jgi:hypothetical protein
LLRDGQGEFLTFRFHGDFAEILVFPRKAMEQVTDTLMSENGIPKWGTDDMLKVWDARAPAGRRRPVGGSDTRRLIAAPAICEES